MPLSLQAKMLRFLETRRYMRVGGTKKIEADVRLVLATLRPLEQEVRAGRFRPDLYYRIQGIVLDVPPLRERRRDIPHLLDAFIAQLSAIHDVEPPTFVRSTRAALLAYDWPGNVRELRNVIERAAALADPRALGGDDATRLGELRASLGRTMNARLPLESAREQFDREYLRDLLAATQGSITASPAIGNGARASARAHARVAERRCPATQVSPGGGVGPSQPRSPGPSPSTLWSVIPEMGAKRAIPTWPESRSGPATSRGSSVAETAGRRWNDGTLPPKSPNGTSGISGWPGGLAWPRVPICSL